MIQEGFDIANNYYNADEDRQSAYDHFLGEKGYSSIDDFIQNGEDGEWQYVRWATAAVFQEQETSGVSLEEAIETVSDPKSSFHRELEGVERSGYSTEPGGKFARFLEGLELRDDGAWWRVGDTPER